MSDTPFYLTRMGRTFYEGTMPGLVRELVRLNENLERLLAPTAGGAKQAAEAPPGDSGPEDCP